MDKAFSRTFTPLRNMAFWGVEPQHKNRINQVMENDWLLFYGKETGFNLCKSLSHPFIDESKVWTDRTYPCRVRISKPIQTNRALQFRNISKFLVDEDGYAFSSPHAAPTAIRGKNGVFRKLQRCEYEQIFDTLTWVLPSSLRAEKTHLE